MSKNKINNDFDVIDETLKDHYNNEVIEIQNSNLFGKTDFTFDKELLDSIDSSLQKIGTSIPSHSIHRLIKFENKLKKVKQDSFYQQIETIAIFMVTVVIFIILFKCFMCTRSRYKLKKRDLRETETEFTR